MIISSHLTVSLWNKGRKHKYHHIYQIYTRNVYFCTFIQITSLLSEKNRTPQPQNYNSLTHMPLSPKQNAILLCTVQLLSSALFWWLLASVTLPPPVGKGDCRAALGSRSPASECAMGKVRWCNDAVLPGVVPGIDDGGKSCNWYNSWRFCSYRTTQNEKQSCN